MTFFIFRDSIHVHLKGEYIMKNINKLKELKSRLKVLKDDFYLALDEVVEENVIEPFKKNKNHTMSKTK